MNFREGMIILSLRRRLDLERSNDFVLKICEKIPIKTLAAAGIKNGDMLMAVHADMLQYNSAGPSNSNGGSRSRTSSTTGQPDFDASARQLIQSCRNDRQKRNQVRVPIFLKFPLS